MIKRIHITVVFMYYVSCLLGQTELKGVVLDSMTSTPIQGVIIMSSRPEDSSILAYAISDELGSFSMLSHSWPDSVDVNFKSMMTEDKLIRCSGKLDFLEVFLTPKDFEIEEVTINAPSTRQSGDTINYYVFNYADTVMDRTIGDVLKRLPGIQVLSSGKILYQNAEISKFYIEGLDLLQGKYAIATNNIEASDVAVVQILENHQPIKVLHGTEMPQSAAINLKLNESARNVFFLSAQLGGGLPNNISSNELVGTRFTRTQQNLLMYKGDKSGRDVCDELVSFYNALDSKEFCLFAPHSSAPSLLDKQHYLFNNAHVISLNDLRLVGRDMTLTSNLAYLYDQSSGSSLSRQELNLKTEKVNIVEAMTSKNRKRELDGAVFLERNEDESYFCNRFNMLAKWNDSEVGIVGKTDADQLQELPSITVGNESKFLVKKDGRTIQLQSSFSFHSQDQKLYAEPFLLGGLPLIDSVAVQGVLYRKGVMEISFREYRETKNGWHYSLDIAPYANHQELSTMMYALGMAALRNDSLMNALQRRVIGLKTSVGIGKILPNRSFGLSFPLDIFRMQRANSVMSVSSAELYAIPSPYIYGEYSKARFTFRIDGKYEKQLSDITDEMTGYLLTSYRNASISLSDILPEMSRSSAGLLILYKKPSAEFYATTSFGIDYLSSNTLIDISLDDITSTMQQVVYPNHGTDFKAEITVEKCISQMSTTAKLSGSWVYGRAPVLCQHTLSDCRHSIGTISPFLITKIGRAMAIEYNTTLSSNNYLIDSSSAVSFFYLDESLSLAFFPLKSLSFKTSANHYYNNALASDASISFINLGADYRYKKMHFMLDWTNITRNERFSVYTFSDVSSFYSSYNLRPSEVLLRVRFSLF